MWLVLGYCLSVGAMLAVAWKLRQSGYRLSYVTGDIVALTGQSLLVGVFSQVCLGLWAVAAGIALMGGLILRRRASDPRAGGYLLACSAVTFLLLADDMFMIHERIFPRGLRINDNYMYVLYAVFAAAIAARYWRQIFRSDLRLAIAGVALMFGSVAIDAILSLHSDLANFIEDVLKFLGVVTWVVYLGQTALAWASEPVTAPAMAATSETADRAPSAAARFEAQPTPEPGVIARPVTGPLAGGLLGKAR
jgi:hypothetical protein